MDDTSFDPTRRLCPDGSCVGLIGPDGRCTVCAQTDSAAAAEDVEPTAAASSGQPSEDGFDAARRLCDDGSCVGLIGPDGVCTVCRQKAGT